MDQEKGLHSHARPRQIACEEISRCEEMREVAIHRPDATFELVLDAGLRTSEEVRW